MPKRKFDEVLSDNAINADDNVEQSSIDNDNEKSCDDKAEITSSVNGFRPPNNKRYLASVPNNNRNSHIVLSHNRNSHAASHNNTNDRCYSSSLPNNDNRYSDSTPNNGGKVNGHYINHFRQQRYRAGGAGCYPRNLTLSKSKRVSFGAVTVYYFQRSQGFSCVPTTGGSTLGMSRKHYACRSMRLAEHQVEVRRYRESCLKQQGSHQFQQQNMLQLSATGLPPQADTVCDSGFYHYDTQMSTDDQDDNPGGDYDEYDYEEDDDDEEDEDEEGEDDEEEEANEDQVDSVDRMTIGQQQERAIIGQQQQQGLMISNDDSSCFVVSRTDQSCSTISHVTEGEENVKNDDAREIDELVAMPDEYFLQPLDSKQRRAILKNLGVQIDRKERDECQSIRISRQKCGCNCRGGQCLPETCACAIDQIKCQVDRPTFPCSCTQQGCKNQCGRVEFNAVRVRSHFMTTMMRIRLTNGRKDDVIGGTCVDTPSPVHTRFDTESDYKTTYLEEPPQQEQQKINIDVKKEDDANVIYNNVNYDDLSAKLTKVDRFSHDKFNSQSDSSATVTCSSDDLRPVQLESIFDANLSTVVDDWSIEKLESDESDFYEQRTAAVGTGSTTSTDSDALLFDSGPNNRQLFDPGPNRPLAEYYEHNQVGVDHSRNSSSYVLATLYTTRQGSSVNQHQQSKDIVVDVQDFSTTVSTTEPTYSLASLYTHHPNNNNKYTAQQQRSLSTNCQNGSGRCQQDIVDTVSGPNDLFQRSSYAEEFGLLDSPPVVFYSSKNYENNVSNGCHGNSCHSNHDIVTMVTPDVTMDDVTLATVADDDDNVSGGSSYSSLSSKTSTISSSSASTLSSQVSTISSASVSTISCIDNEPSSSLASSSSSSSFMPGSPPTASELSAVLKKSICESVLA